MDDDDEYERRECMHAKYYIKIGIREKRKEKIKAKCITLTFQSNNKKTETMILWESIREGRREVSYHSILYTHKVSKAYFIPDKQQSE